MLLKNFFSEVSARAKLYTVVTEIYSILYIVSKLQKLNKTFRTFCIPVRTLDDHQARSDTPNAAP